jgi:hypothetical protein
MSELQQEITEETQATNGFQLVPPAQIPVAMDAVVDVVR